MTQRERIKEFIRTNGSITPIEAAYYLGVIDLARTVSNMRKQGDRIIGTPEKGTNRFGDKVRYYRYTMEETNG